MPGAAPGDGGQHRSEAVPPGVYLRCHAQVAETWVVIMVKNPVAHCGERDSFST